MIDVSQYAVNLMGWLFKRHLDKVYCVNLKSVNTKIISGLLFCYKKKANQMQDEKLQAVVVINSVACSYFSCGLIIDCTITFSKMLKPHQSVHGFWIYTVTNLWI